ncbi:hypothetical protein PG990_010497 [Apiospora arundinis]
MSLADKLYASLPSDEDRKEVNSLRGQGLDPNARLAREAELAERLTPLFENGTLAMGHNVDWDDYGELTFMDPGDHNRKKSSGMTYTPVSYENDRALGDAVKALTIRGAKSVSHLLRQMKKLQRAQDLRPKSKHLFNALVESVRALQLDSAVIGNTQLAHALQNTYTEEDLQDMYRIPEGGLRDVLSCLVTEEGPTLKITQLRLLESTLVLAKFTCLATCLAVALAPKFGRGTNELDVHKALKKSTLQGVFHQYRWSRVQIYQRKPGTI